VQALELFFDPVTEAAVKDVWAQLEAAGYRAWPAGRTAAIDHTSP
jgi:hypothetical protein